MTFGGPFQHLQFDDPVIHHYVCPEDISSPFGISIMPNFCLSPKTPRYMCTYLCSKQLRNGNVKISHYTLYPSIHSGQYSCFCSVEYGVTMQ